MENNQDNIKNQEKPEKSSKLALGVGIGLGVAVGLGALGVAYSQLSDNFNPSFEGETTKYGAVIYEFSPEQEKMMCDYGVVIPDSGIGVKGFK